MPTTAPSVPPTIPHAAQAAARAWPDAPAVIEDGVVTTFAALWVECRAAAAALLARGVGVGDTRGAGGGRSRLARRARGGAPGRRPPAGGGHAPRAAARLPRAAPRHPAPPPPAPDLLPATDEDELAILRRHFRAQVYLAGQSLRDHRDAAKLLLAIMAEQRERKVQPTTTAAVQPAQAAPVTISLTPQEENQQVAAYLGKAN